MVDGTSDVKWPAWQPIESAPRRGELLILLDASGLVLGFFHIPERCWYRYANGADYEIYPTHWMPLPPPSED